MNQGKSCFFALALFLLLPILLSANPFMGGSPGEGAIEAPPQRSVGRPLPDRLRDFQLSVKEESGRLLSEFGASGSAAALLAILGLTFLYGLLHALGPGHSKSVVFSLFLGANAPWWQPLGAGFLFAGIHGAMSLGLVAVLSLLREGVASLLSTEQATGWIDAVSAFLLLFLAIFLIVRKLLGKHHHHHGIENSRNIWAVVATTSLVPCSGATMVLLLALHLDMMLAGVMAILSMSLGMGIVVSGAAYLAWAGRSTLFQRLKTREQTLHRIADTLEYGSYGFLLVIAILLVVPLFGFFVSW